ncbi:hypothetical protein KP509_24G006400 [Ceratopteris richardii]|uniref:Protein SPA, chloroplastic n=1 Tax=Ceratopteris richardii TaxID=49495 RepID=A0A8T2RTW3_CERRI|nr:hypothetical protein KP509_24G006400 [Ceratopteris richardii]
MTAMSVHQCLHSSLVCAVGESAVDAVKPTCSHRLSSSFVSRAPVFLRTPMQSCTSHRPRSISIRAIEFDQDTILAVSVGLAGIAVGIGVPVFYEAQMKGAATRENDQPCFPCSGSGAQTCRFCLGSGSITVDLGVGENEVSKCVNCEGAGSITCTTCQGSGIQPRYLDRREFKDDD